MAQTAPYHNAMRLGQGFNSYTQELRLDKAVTIVAPKETELPPTAQDSSTATSPSPTPPPPSPANDGAPDSNIHAPIAKAVTIVPKPVDKSDLPPVADLKDSEDRAMVDKDNSVLRGQGSSAPKDVQLYTLPPGKVKNGNQSVTFSSRSISNMTDIMDALNISASMSIKYGTIHGNGNASFVNEDKVLDSQMNYLVNVRVNNNDVFEPEEMTFNGHNRIPPEKFTEVYGDCFIAGFQTGGEFNAIISVDVHDKSKAEHVKESIELQLAVPPVPGLEIGGGQSFDKSHSELFRGVEITISVNWTGGGEVKPPGVRWDLNTVMAAANAYPSMVARSAAKISAILKPYTSLKTFVDWQYERWDVWAKKVADEKDPKKKAELEDSRDTWTDKKLILNYAPCQVYTNDLFDAFISYKKLWKRISFIMSDTTKWRARTVAEVVRENGRMIDDSPVTAKDYKGPPIIKQPVRQNSKPIQPTLEDIKENETPNRSDTNGSNATTASEGSIAKDFAPAHALKRFDTFAVDEVKKANTVPLTPHVGINRFETFPVQDDAIHEDWDVHQLNDLKKPIALDAFELNEARLICREAMTLITEEAYSLVYHPDLAYAQYDKWSTTTKMKRPIYMYPEVLKARLPVFVRNDAATDRRSRDPVIMKLKQYDNNDLWANLVGDDLNPQRWFTDFVSLERNENTQYDNPLISLSIHAYAHSARYHLSPWWAESDRCIGGFGFRFENDKDEPADDGCTQWEGHWQDKSRFRKMLTLRNGAKALKKSMEKSPEEEEKHKHRSMLEALSRNSSHAVKLDAREPEAPRPDLQKAAAEDRNITQIDIYHVHGSGRIAGLVFHDAFGETDLAWTQWEGTINKPSNMDKEEQYPPKDGTKWKFVGLMGDWDHGMMGRNKVLARVSGIWRKM